MAGSALFSDFDGTITRNDFYCLIAQRYMPPNAPNFFEQYRRGELSHVQAMQGFFQYAPSEPKELERLLVDTEPDPQFRATVERMRQCDWELIIVSAGSSWYIEKIL